LILQVEDVMAHDLWFVLFIDDLISLAFGESSVDVFYELELYYAGVLYQIKEQLLRTHVCFLNPPVITNMRFI
jgi:hypothetical protein